MAQGGLVGEVLGLLSALLVLRAQVAVPSHLGAGRHLLNFAGPGPSIAATANARLGRGHRLDVASLLFRVKQVDTVADDEIVLLIAEYQPAHRHIHVDGFTAARDDPRHAVIDAHGGKARTHAHDPHEVVCDHYSHVDGELRADRGV